MMIRDLVKRKEEHLIHSEEKRNYSMNSGSEIFKDHWKRWKFADLDLKYVEKQIESHGQIEVEILTFLQKVMT